MKVFVEEERQWYTKGKAYRVEAKTINCYLLRNDLGNVHCINKKACRVKTLFERSKIK